MLIENFDRLKNELGVLAERLIPIRLGDLLVELALLFGIEVGDIYVDIEIDISFYGKHDMLQMIEFINDFNASNCRTNNSKMKLDLFGCNEEYATTCEPVFEYYSLLPVDLEEYQDDGRKLIDYCSIKYAYDDNGVYTKIVINKDIENIVCNFNLGYLDRENDSDWKPADMFTQAIINCLEKGYVLVRKK